MKPWNEDDIKAATFAIILEWGNRDCTISQENKLMDLEEDLAYELVLKQHYLIKELLVVQVHGKTRVFIKGGAPHHNTELYF